MIVNCSCFQTPNDEDIFEAVRCSIDLVSLVYICRLYMKLSNLPSIMLSSTGRTQLIQEAVTDRYNDNHSIEDILMVTNIIEMNRDMINRVLLLSDLDKNNVLLDINCVTIDVPNDLILFPFTDTCVDCAKPLTLYWYKSIRIIDYLKLFEQ